MLDSRRRGRRKGVNVRPGSVTQARHEAGLTLAQVAGTEVSRAAIHLIETGRTRPSMETLELIAERTGKPLDFFLVDPTLAEVGSDGVRELRELERLTATRDYRKVVDVATPLVDKPWSRGSQAMVRFFLGQAHCRLCQPVPALDLLGAARSMFEQVGDEWMAVEALDWESSAMAIVEDPRALAFALEALDRCRRLDPVPAPTEARILSHIAGMHVSAHSWTQAKRYYEEALRAADGIKDLLQLAKMHHGLGTIYQGMNQHGRASHHFDKALALYSIESDLGAVFRVENDIGELLLRQGQLESAEPHLQKALRGSGEFAVEPKLRGFALANMAEVSLRKGDLELAAKYLTQAVEIGQGIDDQVILANADLILGDLAEVTQDRTAADLAFRSALKRLDALSMPQRSREAHMHYAEVLEGRGDFRSASGEWRAAAQIGAAGPGVPGVTQPDEASAAG